MNLLAVLALWTLASLPLSLWVAQQMGRAGRVSQS